MRVVCVTECVRVCTYLYRTIVIVVVYRMISAFIRFVNQLPFMQIMCFGV